MNPNSSKRKFDPWVGTKYWSEGHRGIRILILGESQYTERRTTSDDGEPRPDDTSSTISIVNDLVLTKRNRFFTKVAKLVLGSPSGKWISNKDRVDLFQSVAFYNYVQWWLPGPRCRPTNEMWEESIPAFEATISELDPDLVVALGKGLQARIPALSRSISKVDVMHPSAFGFKYSDHSENLESTIRRCIETKNSGIKR